MTDEAKPANTAHSPPRAPAHCFSMSRRLATTTGVDGVFGVRGWLRTKVPPPPTRGHRRLLSGEVSGRGKRLRGGGGGGGVTEAGFGGSGPVLALGLFWPSACLVIHAIRDRVDDFLSLILLTSGVVGGEGGGEVGRTGTIAATRASGDGG